MKITFIEHSEHWSKVETLCKSDRFVVFPLFLDDTHPIKSSPIVVFAKPLMQDEIFVFGMGHIDCVTVDFDFEMFNQPFVFSKKYFNLKDSIDIESVYYVQNKEYTIDLFKSQEDWQTYPIYKILDKLVPTLQEFSTECALFIDSSGENKQDIKFINQITIPTLCQIESYGIKVDDTFEQKDLIIDGLVYSQYNHLTTTGRPSNRYGGLNFSALNKADGSRKPFTSRFSDGVLFLLDYDSYHLRLIAELIGYDLPKDSVHTFFAKQYFQTDNITEEQYEESKQISFRLLYGGLTPEYEHVQFFRSVQHLLDELWTSHQENGFVPSVISKIPISADSKTKLFNYVIQNYETEQNMLVMRKILLETKQFESVPILYTYDSILFDVKGGETETYLNTVKRIMEINGKFPVKTSYGQNYGEMTKL